MAKIRIVTDATASLKPEFIAQHQITVLPVEIGFGGERFVINSGDNGKRLFERMAQGTAKPCQAGIPAQTLQRTFEQLNKKTEDTLIILSSARLSQGYAQARAAARLFLGRCRIEVVDSMSASWGLGLVVRQAVEAAEAGLSLEETVRRIRGLLPHIYVVFFVDRLDYLERGNRIGVAQALLGTMLRIKPLLLIEEGEIVPLEKVRTVRLAVEKLSNFVAEFAQIEELAILQSPLAEEMNPLIKGLREQLRMTFPGRQFPVLAYDPILACHLGPEALGLMVYEKD